MGTGFLNSADADARSCGLTCEVNIELANIGSYKRQDEVKNEDEVRRKDLKARR